MPILVRRSGPQRPEGEKRKVGFEVKVKACSVDLGRHRVQLQYAAAVKELNGKIVTRWGETPEGDVTPQQEQQIASGGITHRGAVSLAAGNYLVRFVVRDDMSGHIGSVQAAAGSEVSCELRVASSLRTRGGARSTTQLFQRG